VQNAALPAGTRSEPAAEEDEPHTWAVGRRLGSRPACAHNEYREAARSAELEEVLASMSLRVWRSDETTPLTFHPNDPAIISRW